MKSKTTTENAAATTTVPTETADASAEVSAKTITDAIVLAGGDGSIIDPQISAKGLVQVAGKPMVQWVLEALRKANSIRQIAVVLPPGQDISSWQHLTDHIAYSGGQISENVAAGLDVLSQNDLPQSDLIIGVTSDIPTVSPEAIDDLVAQTVERRAELSYPIVPEAVMLAAYPDAQRTFIKIRDGKVTGGNAVLFDPRHFQTLRDFAQGLFDARKSPLKLANTAGLKFVLKVATGRLNVRDAEDRLKQLIGVESAAIYSNYASIGADVDKPADVAVAEAKLAANQEFLQ